MGALCHKTKNRAFIAPDKATAQALRAAARICSQCPLIKDCARQALNSGTTLDGVLSPAAGVFQAGILCRGDYETSARLSLICGDSVPDAKAPQRRRIASHCRNCHRPMMQWTREAVPEGYVMHHGRDFCTECRRAYRDHLTQHPPAAKGLKKRVDRKRHTAPKPRGKTAAIQLALFTTERSL